jgi:hypothetical protein
MLKKLEQKMSYCDYYISSCYNLLARYDISTRSDKKIDICSIFNSKMYSYINKVVKT